MKKIIYLIIFLYCTIVNAQYHQQGIDTVYQFVPGKGQNVGQQPKYFPKNIFGLPDTTARYDFQAANPESVCSLGFGGEIIIGFKDYIVIDGPGADFTVFENAFLNPITQKIFAEPAKVAVSKDGIHYVEFPYDSATLQGCAGVTPTYGNKNPFNPEESGGDKFDIGSLGLDWIKYIKITDISEMVLNNTKHSYYDPTITGFDLDAVIGLHLKDTTLSAENINNYENKAIIRYLQNGIGILTNTGTPSDLTIYNYDGKLVERKEFVGEIFVNDEHYPAGLYFAVISDKTGVIGTGKFFVNY